MEVIASAPAKTILFGEHFVVYGEPALVLAIDRRVYAKVGRRSDLRVFLRSVDLNLAGYFEGNEFQIECGNLRDARAKLEPIKNALDKVMDRHGKRTGLSVEIKSTVPIGAGLGSSAAVIAAASAATGRLFKVKLPRDEIFKIVLEAEKTVHGNPSGVDPAISTFGGALLFQMDTGFKPLEVKTNIPLVIGDTGVSRSTRIQVEKVRSFTEKFPKIAEHFRKTARDLVLRAVEELEQNDLETLGSLMNINHALLCGLGVSDESLEWLANAARKAGAIGAKLTGAGGGGCIIALARDEKLEQVSAAIQRAGGRAFIARKTDEGVRVESD